MIYRATREIQQYLSQNLKRDVSIHEDERSSCVRLNFRMNSSAKCTVILTSIDDSNEILISIHAFFSCSRERRAQVLEAVNELNAKAQGITFVLGEANNLAALYHCSIGTRDIGPSSTRMVGSMLNAIEAAYPELMRAQWG